MLSSIRSALLIIATLSASSVAPAQVGPTTTNEALEKVATFVVPAEVAQPLPSEATGVEPEVEQAAEEPVPVKPATGDLSDMVAQLRGTDPGSRELECLAVGIYFEAKSEPLIGQLAVGEVIANRARSGRFASTYCGVLFQRGQFSFVRGRSWPAVARSGRQWQNAVAIAKIVDWDLKDSAADKALFFHARRVSPGWRLKRVASIGNHIFYR